MSARFVDEPLDGVITIRGKVVPLWDTHHSLELGRTNSAG